MSNIIKAGSIGFKTYTNNPLNLETKFFKVEKDTDIESEKIPVIFNNKPNKVVMLRMNSISFTKKLLID